MNELEGEGYADINELQVIVSSVEKSVYKQCGIPVLMHNRVRVEHHFPNSPMCS